MLMAIFRPGTSIPNLAENVFINFTIELIISSLKIPFQAGIAVPGIPFLIVRIMSSSRGRVLVCVA